MTENETYRINNTYPAGEADVAVVGAGHAGIEAALACARLGLDTLLFTINLDGIANMPCNPSIGGTGKGHLVFEIDALGGEMGRAADAVTLQSRMLNSSKGPAVRSKRIQADRSMYHRIMKSTVEHQKNLRLIQAEIVDFRVEDGHIASVITRLGAEWRVGAAVLSTGTYLRGEVVIGEVQYPSGPDGMLPSEGLERALKREGIVLQRFKTGTPPRVARSSIDFSRLELQEGDGYIVPFSSLSDEEELNRIQQLPCHVVYTNAETHAIIRENLDRSPIYNGSIHGTGPRYCPSIEDKVVRFSDKERHQLFVEPMGADTEEMYIQGFSSSMPEEVQRRMLRSLPGFEHAATMRSAYAIQYDCIDPLQLAPTLEFKTIKGLYGAGQFNGSSGYEEAAAQGLVAGINAALAVKGEEPMILTRDSSYIGTLIDDLVTKGTREPYRIMTSRSEYRLLLRQDNADARLTEIGRRVGLVGDEQYRRYTEKRRMINEEIARLRKTTVSPSEENNAILASLGTAPIASGTTLDALLRRPELDYDRTAELDPDRPVLPRAVREGAWIEIKYEGYIKRQLAEAKRQRKYEKRLLPEDIDYLSIRGLRREAAEKLDRIRPESIGRASRISGVSPADISVLLVWLSGGGRASGSQFVTDEADVKDSFRDHNSFCVQADGGQSNAHKEP